MGPAGLGSPLNVMISLFFLLCSPDDSQLLLNYLLTVLLEHLMPKRGFLYFTPRMALLSSFQ